jgi:hypothetical protein
MPKINENAVQARTATLSMNNSKSSEDCIRAIADEACFEFEAFDWP